MGKQPEMVQVQADLVQVTLEIPREVATYLDELANSVGQTRRSLVREEYNPNNPRQGSY